MGLLGAQRAGWILRKELAQGCLPSIRPPYPALGSLLGVSLPICPFIH